VAKGQVLLDWPEARGEQRACGLFQDLLSEEEHTQQRSQLSSLSHLPGDQHDGDLIPTRIQASKVGTGQTGEVVLQSE
jgi:hypothetical protein